MFGLCTPSVDCGVEPKRVSEDTLLPEKIWAYSFHNYFSALNDTHMEELVLYWI